MKKILLLLTIIFIFSAVNNLFAQRNSVKNGIGLIVGDPTGVSIKFLNSGYRHFNGAVSWNSGNRNHDGSLYLHADYIFKKWNIFSGRATNFQTFIGAGLGLNTGAEALGVRIPLGIGYVFSEVPIDAHIEVVPGLLLIPDTDFFVDAAFSIRFLF
jgi:hypothetical protein